MFEFLIVEDYASVLCTSHGRRLCSSVMCSFHGEMWKNQSAVLVYYSSIFFLLRHTIFRIYTAILFLLLERPHRGMPSTSECLECPKRTTLELTASKVLERDLHIVPK